MEQYLLANAELVRNMARNELGIAVNYDEAGVQWLDGYINRLRNSVTEEVKNKLPNTLGSFFGECIRHTHGGQWVASEEEGWSIKVNDKVSVFPFNKIRKQFANEDGDSVLSLFTAIPLVAAGLPTSSTVQILQTPKRPWWRFW